MNTLQMISRAAEYAIWQHQGQARDDGCTPYIIHPARVARICADLAYTEKWTQRDTMILLSVAYLHDVIEDTPATYDELLKLFGLSIADLVLGLTNQYTKERYPQLNREDRQKKEAARLAERGVVVQLVKLADRLDNLRDLDVDQRPEYAQVRADETLALVDRFKRSATYRDHHAVQWMARVVQEEAEDLATRALDVINTQVKSEG